MRRRKRPWAALPASAPGAGTRLAAPAGLGGHPDLWKRLGSHGVQPGSPQCRQHFVTQQRPVPVMLSAPGPSPLWLVRPRSDGGSDYVRFLPAAGVSGTPLVEVREGSHLPPQMPLLKRRRRLAPAEAEACRRHLQQEAGYRRSDPLF